MARSISFFFLSLFIFVSSPASAGPLASAIEAKFDGYKDLSDFQIAFIENELIPLLGLSLIKTEPNTFRSMVVTKRSIEWSTGSEQRPSFRVVWSEAETIGRYKEDLVILPAGSSVPREQLSKLLNRALVGNRLHPYLGSALASNLRKSLGEEAVRLRPEQERLT